MNKRLFSYALGTILLLGMMSCSPERKLAKEFVENDHDLSFLLMVPDFIYKINLKKYELEGEDTTTEWKKDSVLLSKSLFLKDIDDTAFLDRYISSFVSQLDKFGFEVYPESEFDSLLQARSNAFILNIAQYSVEEYVHPFTSDQVVGSELLTIKDIDLNALNFNTWIEISRMNSDSKRVLLFTSDHIYDNINGTFKQYLFNPDITFEYTIDTITLENIYQEADYLGRKDGNNLFDYLMNKYMISNLPKNYQYNPQYFHYNPEKGTIRVADPENGFIEMKDK